MTTLATAMMDEKRKRCEQLKPQSQEQLDGMSREEIKVLLPLLQNYEDTLSAIFGAYLKINH